MICPKCKREVSDKVSICPQCGSVLDKNKAQKNSVKTSKNVKSKITVSDDQMLVGGTFSKESFISLNKKATKTKEPLRKDFNNYIDYKEAKEKEKLKKSKITTESKSLIKSLETEEILKNVNANDKATKTITLRKNNNNIKKDVVVDNVVSPFNKKEKITQDQIYSKKDIMVETVSVPNAVRKELIQNNIKNSSSISDNKYFNTPGDAKKTNKHVSFITVDKVESVEKKKSVFNLFKLVTYIIVILLWASAISTLVKANTEDYYFSEDKNVDYSNTNNIDQDLLNYNGVSKSGQVGGASSEGKTSIVYDNQYLEQMTFSNENDVKNLIIADSIKQKDSCPANIVNIENEIINNYGITAVNLCEIDEELALELRDVIKLIYTKYPSARNYLTNVTIANVGAGNSYIAAFMPSFSFATSNTTSGFPVAIKTQIILNAASFLNITKFKNEVDRSSKSGYFPPNATKSSTVAHEFGHYLSFIAMLNHYNSKQLNFVKASQYSLYIDVMNDFDSGTFSYELLTKAYEEYKKEYSGVSFDDFRNSISRYAMAKDSKGLYIYDETIAEAFHDVYLNGDNAKPASKYIVLELEKNL